MLPAPVTPQSEASETLRSFPTLTEMEEGFVHAYVANGGKLKDAAITAGYAKGSAHVSASRLIRKPAVIRAIAEASTLALGALVPQAIQQVAKLGMQAKSEYVRLEASRDLLDRVGMAAPKQVKVGGSLNVSFDLS